MRRLLLPLLFSIVLSGCADTTQLTHDHNNGGRRLVSSDSVFIAVPKDGFYGAETYNNSGVTTSQIILSAFAKHLRRVDTGKSYQEFDEALTYAKNNNYSVLVYPTILHWEDRATEWSLLPDRLEVKIEVIDSTNGSVIDSIIISGKSGLATIGGDHPQDLLPKPIEAFSKALF